MAIKAFLREAGIDAILEGIQADGGVIVRDFIMPELVARLNSELDAHIETAAAGSGDYSTDRFMTDFWGTKTKRFTRLAARTKSFADLLDHDLMHQWASRALKQGYWLNTGQAMIVGPGEKAQVLHRDIALWPMFSEGGPNAPEAMVSIVLALSDFTEEVGATRVVVGSHRWEDFSQTADPANSVPAAMPAGSALLYLGKTIHGAGANVTESSWRRGLHMGFVLGWLTPEEASPIGVPWDIAKSYPERVQRMLGFISPTHKADGAPFQWLIDFKDVGLYVNAVESRRFTHR